MSETSAIDEIKALLDSHHTTDLVGRLNVVGDVSGVLVRPEGYRLLRRSEVLASAVHKKIPMWRLDIRVVRENHPELASQCDHVNGKLDRLVSRCGAIMRREHNFRHVVRPPRRYDDEF